MMAEGRKNVARLALSQVLDGSVSAGAAAAPQHPPKKAPAGPVLPTRAQPPPWKLWLLLPAAVF